MQVGIDVESIDRYKTAESVRTITEGIDFVTLAAAAGWKFGGVADTATPRLGIWTRLFREGDPRGALIALIPAMALKSDKELPILLVEEATPLALARRLQLFADTMKWPFNQSSNTTALDLMLHTRPRTYSWQDWKDRVFAPSTTEPPYRTDRRPKGLQLDPHSQRARAAAPVRPRLRPGCVLPLRDRRPGAADRRSGPPHRAGSLQPEDARLLADRGARARRMADALRAQPARAEIPRAQVGDHPAAGARHRPGL